MDSLRSYLLSDKNITMLESIIIDKLYDTTGISLNKRDSKFQQSMMLVISTVIRNELHLQKTFDKKTLLKMNNIFIKETVNYLTELLTQQEEEEEDEEEQEFTSKLSEEDYEMEMDPGPLPVLETPVIHEQPLEQKEQVTEDIYYFDETSTDVNLENVTALQLMNITIDYSGYIVNETNCNICIENNEHEIPHGNYSPVELVEYLSSLEKTLDFSLEQKTDVIIMSIVKEKERKSMSGSIKDKDNPKQVNVNFGVKNSVAKLLGFIEKTYVIRDNNRADTKHLIKHPGYSDFVIKYSDTLEEKHRVYFNKNYNETIHYIPYLNKGVKTDIPVTITNISITSDYNSNRPFNFCVKVSKHS